MRDELKLGAGAAPVAGVLVDLLALVDDLEPDQVPGRHAVDLLRVLDRIERVAAAAKGQAMRRVAETDLWRRAGARTPADWLARETGVKVGDAIRALETAQVSADQPDTAEAVRSGQVSPREAHAVARASKADPAAGRKLLDDVKARRVNVTDTERQAARIVTAASRESDTERAARHHAVRSLRAGVDHDGMGWGHWRLPLAEHTRLLAGIAPGQEAAFRAARTDGRREPTDAYAADGLLALLHPPARRTGQADNGVGDDRVDHQSSDEPSPDARREDGAVHDRTTRRDPEPRPDAASDDHGPGSADTASGGRSRPSRRRGPGRAGPWGGAKVIFRVDAAAAARGHTEPGELCEIAGQGPVPLPAVFDAIDGGALVTAVLTEGVDIHKVTHLGRHPTALQRTALEWTNAGACAVRGCTSTARIEIDHVAPWADTHRTELPQLAPVCGHHHDLKTHHGYQFGPPGPDGRRPLLPPPEPGQRPPDDPPTSDHRPAPADPEPGHPAQPEPPPALFDTS